MTRNSSMRGEKIYEVDLDIVGMTDYGVSLQAILAGEEKIPSQGARFDVAFDGHSTGRLSRRVHGVDYLRLRADGRLDLDIRATIETVDGHRIAASIDGMCVPRPNEPITDLFENVRLTTAAADYAWVERAGDLGRGDRELGHQQNSHRRVHAMTAYGDVGRYPTMRKGGEK